MNGQIHFNIALACQSQLIHLKELFWYNLKKFSYLIFSFIAISKDTFFTGRAFFLRATVLQQELTLSPRWLRSNSFADPWVC